MRTYIHIGFLLSVFVFITAVFWACEKKEEKIEEGTVEFIADGEKYTFRSMQLIVRANPKIWDGRKVKEVKKGEINNYEFSIVKGKYKGEKKEDDSFKVVWILKTDDPYGIVGSRIAFGEKKELSNISFNIYVTEWWIKSPDGKKHSCWVKIDSVSENRITGSFGGLFEFHSLENTELGKKVEIKDGRFDLPLKEYFKF